MTEHTIETRLRDELREVYTHSRGEEQGPYRGSFVCTRCRESTPDSDGGTDLEGLCSSCWVVVQPLFATGEPPTSGMRVIEDVREFYVSVMEHDAWAMMSECEGPPALTRVVTRQRLLRREQDEHVDAQLARDLPETLREIVDQIVILVGTALIQFGGRRFALAWAAVIAANLRKRFPDGTFHVLEDGTILKPEGWVPPDIAAIVEDRVKCETCDGWGDGPGDVVLCPDCDGRGSNKDPRALPLPTIDWCAVEAELRRQGVDPDEVVKGAAAAMREADEGS